MSDSAEKNPGFDRSSVHRKGTSPASTSDARRPVPPPPAARKPRLSIMLKVMLLVGFALALLLGVLATAGGSYWQRALRAQTEAQLGAVAVSRRDMVKAQVALLRQRVTFNTDRGEFRGYYLEIISNRTPSVYRDLSQALLSRFSDGHPIVAASLVNSAGKVLLATAPDEVGRDLSTEPEFQPGLVGPHVGQPRWVDGRFEAVVTAPVYTGPDSHRVYGVLRLVADVSDLAAAVRDVTGLGETGEAILGVRNGEQFQFLLPPRLASRTAGAALAVVPSFKMATGDAAAFTAGRDYRGIPVLAAGRSVGDGGWVLVAKMDESEAYAPIARFQRLCLLSGLIVAVVGLAAAYALALSFTHSIRRQAEATSRVTDGDYETVEPVKSSDEFGALSAAFNEMTASIRQRRRDRDLAEETLRETDQRKNEFLAMLGHELRNPLAAIVHAVQLEQDSADDPDAADLARSVIVRQAGHLTRLVDDLLDVARITQGKIELRRSAVEVRQIVKRAVDAVRPLIVERRHQFDLMLGAGGSKWRVEADPTRLEQIVTNLLANAVKYTPDGGRITLVERQEGRDAVITVSDNGIGIAPEMLPQIFELFTQADHSLDRTSGGLGIGLSLCRQLVELHGGTITAHSNGVGKGAAFTVRLPAILMSQPDSPAPSPGPAQPAVNHPRRRILLVDDNQDTVHALSRLLAARGHEVATAFDGLTALQMAHEFKPDVLLLDLGLPGLDGYELARRLRASGFPQAPIIAISGYAQEGDRARSRAAGFTYHFAKPVDFEALAELIIEEPLSID